MPKLSTSTDVFARIGVGWAGSYVMTRAFCRAVPGEPTMALVADVLNRLDLLASGELDFIWVFPRERVEWAYQGGRPWPNSPWSGEPLSNLRLVARFPRNDFESVAFAPWSPVQSLAELAKHRAVRLVMRTDELYEFESAIFQQYGFTIADLEQAGARIWHIPPGPHELDRELADHTIDMIIGHASVNPAWRDVANAGFRFVPLDEHVVAALEQVGFERKVVPPGTTPWITEPMLTLDLADQPLISRAEVDDEVVYQIARAIDRSKPAIAQASQGQTEALERQWETRIVPLHPGAERYYREAGYLS
jgi:TRAP transporter TAXI family solute receptor